MSRAEHDARNLAQVEMLWAELDTTGTVGSGWNPTAWCKDGAVIGIRLKCGRLALVELEDVDAVAHLSWSVDSSGYPHARGQDGKNVRMHRLLMQNVPRGFLIDHRNGDKLDNRRANLRLANHSENGTNRKGLDRSSPYKGVHFAPESKTNPWRAQIRVNHRRISIGRFPSAKAAALAYDEKARDLHGDFANVNFQDSPPRVVPMITIERSRSGDSAQHAPYPVSLPACPECAPDHERRVLTLFRTYRSLRGLHVTRALGVPADTAARVLGRLELAGQIVVHAGRWHRVGER